MVDSDPPLLVGHYHRLAALTRQMRQSALQAAWDDLPALDIQCSQVMDAIMGCGSPSSLDRNSQLEVARMAEEIIDYQEEIRSLALPWMDQLQRHLLSTGQERRLQQAYSTP